MNECENVLHLLVERRKREESEEEEEHEIPSDDWGASKREKGFCCFLCLHT